MYRIRITTRKNEPVTKTIKINDPATGGKKEVPYTTYEWHDKHTSNIIELPKNARTLSILSEIATSSGFNNQINALDSNIRYIVEIVSSDGDQSSEQIKYWFRCTCEKIVFDLQACQDTNKRTEYRCSYCAALLAFEIRGETLT
ncbi:MAG: hypothetical protein QXJ74_02585 [Nitrososphaera sp.]